MTVQNSHQRLSDSKDTTCRSQRLATAHAQSAASGIGARGTATEKMVVSLGRQGA